MRRERGWCETPRRNPFLVRRVKADEGQTKRSKIFVGSFIEESLARVSSQDKHKVMHPLLVDLACTRNKYGTIEVDESKDQA